MALTDKQLYENIHLGNGKNDIIIDSIIDWLMLYLHKSRVK